MERSKSVSKNQALRLAFKAAAIIAGIACMRIFPGSFAAIGFISLYSFFYFRPSINTEKFFASYFITLGLIFVFPWHAADPRLQFIAMAGFAAIAAIILGVKNLVFINRATMSHWFYFLILGFLNFLFFSGTMGGAAQVAAAVVIFLITAEFYAEAAGNRSAVHAGIMALLYSELLWGLYLLPIGFVSKSLLGMLGMFLSGDLIVHYFNRSLSREIIIRNALVFAVIFMLILKFASSRLG